MYFSYNYLSDDPWCQKKKKRKKESPKKKKKLKKKKKDKNSNKDSEDEDDEFDKALTKAGLLNRPKSSQSNSTDSRKCLCQVFMND